MDTKLNSGRSHFIISHWFSNTNFKFAITAIVILFYVEPVVTSFWWEGGAGDINLTPPPTN